MALKIEQISGLNVPDSFIDVCFSIKQVYHFLAGWLNAKEGKELLALFISNFVKYYNTGCYQVTVTTE